MITAADLIAAYPEWTQVNTSYPTVVTYAISHAEDDVDEDVVGDRYNECLMLSAGAWLFRHPYSRDMRSPNDDSRNPYQEQLDHILRRKGSAYRTVWDSSDFDGYI